MCDRYSKARAGSRSATLGCVHWLWADGCRGPTARAVDLFTGRIATRRWPVAMSSCSSKTVASAPAAGIDHLVSSAGLPDRHAGYQTVNLAQDLGEMDHEDRRA